MKDTTKKILDELVIRYPNLSTNYQNIELAFNLLCDTAKTKNIIFTCGNGGSASDAEHIVGELVKSFKKKRNIDADLLNNLEDKQLASCLEGGIKAVSLVNQVALNTAYSNDNTPEAVFAQSLSVLGSHNDTLIAISTSGNSKNVFLACEVAKAKGIKIVGLTGSKDSKISNIADVCIKVPETETFKVQELHLPVYHALCAMLEEELF